LAREVRDHDPSMALDGGLDGLDAYRALGPQLPSLLGEDGRFFVEFGCGQADRVTAILAGHGLAKLALYADLAGLNRVVSGGVPGLGLIAKRAAKSKNAPQKMPLGVE
jgi:release factor glutamine methyltransferase